MVFLSLLFSFFFSVPSFESGASLFVFFLERERERKEEEKEREKKREL
jgi:hypothetical protein